MVKSMAELISQLSEAFELLPGTCRALRRDEGHIDGLPHIRVKVV